MKITIIAEWGSDFQKESGEGSLITMIDAWSSFYKNRHKNNKISYKFHDKKNETRNL